MFNEICVSIQFFLNSFHHLLVDGLCITVNLMGPGLVCESSAWCCYVNAHLAINLIIITGDMNDKSLHTAYWMYIPLMLIFKNAVFIHIKACIRIPHWTWKKMTVFSVFCLCVYLFILPMYVKFFVIFQGERFYDLHVWWQLEKTEQIWRNCQNTFPL